MPRTKTRLKTNSRMTNGQVTKSRAVINELQKMAANLVASRAAFIQYLNTRLGGHDIDKEAGYPANVDYSMYKLMYEREGVAKRVVTIMATEAWAVEPAVYETEKVDTEAKTPFEKKWVDIYTRYQLYNELYQAEVKAGIGHYGVLFLGLDGGKDLTVPVCEMLPDRTLKRVGKERNLLYVTSLDESQAKVSEWDRDQSSPRFGHPKIYSLKFVDPDHPEQVDGKEVKVHWSRCIHISDGPVFGTPRMKTTFNYLINIRKILGGSAEMFWKGGFPGFAFEVPPEIAAEVELDKAALKEEIAQYMEGLERYMALQGVVAKNLNTQIADPQEHFMVQIIAICIALEVPQRVFMGTEEARLASVQDSESWNKRVQRHQNTFTTPRIIRQVVDRFMCLGILPTVDPYFVSWPDLYSVSEKDRAEIANKIVAALAQYMTSDAQQIIPPLELLTMILNFSPDQAKAILDAADKRLAEEKAVGAVDEAGRVITREEELEREIAEMDHEVKMKQASRPQTFGRPM